MSGAVVWPECFLTGELASGACDAELCADALMSWANCSTGNRPPEFFGHVMAKIGARLRISPTPENLMRWSDEWLANQGGAQ